jgi:glycosyltransferase involved in cell wall biosynthesis
VIALRRNFGQTPALQAGFDQARGDIIVTLDGDLQNDPGDIPKLIERIDAGADVVSGWRFDRQDTLVMRKVPSWIANRMIRWVTGVPVHDQGCSLKAYRAAVVRRLGLYSDMHRFITVMTMPLGAAIEEIGVRHHPRVAGTSKYGISRVFKVLADLLTIQLITRFRESPMRWFAWVGVPFLVASMIFAVASGFFMDGSIVMPTVSLLFGLVVKDHTGAEGADVQDDPNISVLVPVVERHDDLRELYRAVLPELEKLDGRYELLVLVSPEFEEAFEQARELHEADGRVRVLRFARPVGEAAALGSGFEHARGDILITLPAYFDAEPAGIGSLVSALEDGCDLAFAGRIERRDSWIKRIQSRGFERLAAWATGTRFVDLASGMRALRREVASELPLYGDLHRFLPVLGHRAGFAVREVPVAQDARSHAPLVYHPRTYLYRALDILTMFFLSHFTRRPLRLFGAVGAGFGGLGALILLVVTAQRLLGEAALAGRPILILGALLVGIGIQAFTIGLLGELMLFFHARDVRDYRIAEIYESGDGAPSRPRTA